MSSEVQEDEPDTLAGDYERLWYIKLVPGGKNPLEKWGGYDQDFAEAENVYSHAEVVESDHDRWGICGIRDTDHCDLRLLIFDIDIHKAPSDFSRDHVQVRDRDIPLVKSQSGGFHTYSPSHQNAPLGHALSHSVQRTIPT